MIFSYMNIINILLTVNLKPEIIITTLKSCYKDHTYQVSKYQRGNNVRIRRANGYYAYYYNGSYALTEKTHELFQNLKGGSVIEFFKKKIEENDILFNNGRLYKVVKITKTFVYLQIVVKSDYWDWQNEYRVFNFNEGCFELEIDDIINFVKIDDPIALLAI